MATERDRFLEVFPQFAEYMNGLDASTDLTTAELNGSHPIVERFNKEINCHLRALTFDNLSLDNYEQSLPFVRRIFNANYSDRLKISSSQMLFGNMLDLDRGVEQSKFCGR